MFHGCLLLRLGGSWAPGVPYSAVFTQHPEGRRNEPVEELQQQRAVFGALQSVGKVVHPGNHQGLPAQLRRLHVDHPTSADCGRLRGNKTARGRPFFIIIQLHPTQARHAVNSHRLKIVTFKLQTSNSPKPAIDPLLQKSDSSNWTSG